MWLEAKGQSVDHCGFIGYRRHPVVGRHPHSVLGVILQAVEPISGRLVELLSHNSFKLEMPGLAAASVVLHAVPGACTDGRA